MSKSLRCILRAAAISALLFVMELPQATAAPINYNITFTNNHFGRKFEQNCAVLGPVTYWDASQPGMVWSGNVWDDTGQPVKPQY